MIRQYLSNENENATVMKSEIFSELNKALFICEIFLNFATVALSFVCGKFCPIID